MSAVDELLDRLTEIGATITPAGDRLILRAGGKPVPAELVKQLRQSKAEVLAALTDRAVPAEQSEPLFERLAQSIEGEPSLQQPCTARRGRVQQLDGALLHFCCRCGQFGAFGYGVRLRAGRLGRWYCAEHRPRSSGAV